MRLFWGRLNCIAKTINLQLAIGLELDLNWS